MATAFLRSGTIHIPAVYSDASGVSWRTQSTVASRLLSTKSQSKHISEHDVAKAQAVAKIEVWWCKMRNRKIFRILKEAIRAAEHSMTHDVIRKVCPSEAELLKDPTMKAKIKFRFGGDQFPPIVMFKIFISSCSSGVKYISGKRMIRPETNAAKDAQRWMGNRTFYDQMLVDACQHQQLKITDEVDVTTMQEYMQYASTVDETPSYLGGKDNTWRKLSLDALPRQSVIYNVVELLERSVAPGGLSLEKLRGFTGPPTQVEQIQRIKTVSSLGGGTSPGSRGSRLARQRAKKMREAYGMKSPGTPSSQDPSATFKSPHSPSHNSQDREKGEGDGEDSDWEKEASDLYQWTQTLSLEDIR